MKDDSLFHIWPHQTTINSYGSDSVPSRSTTWVHIHLLSLRRSASPDSVPFPHVYTPCRRLCRHTPNDFHPGTDRLVNKTKSLNCQRRQISHLVSYYIRSLQGRDKHVCISPVSMANPASLPITDPLFPVLFTQDFLQRELWNLQRRPHPAPARVVGFWLYTPFK